MTLKIQIYSLVYSVIFGIVFYYMLKLLDKMKFKKHIMLKLIVSLLYVLLASGIYFWGLVLINNGYVHSYFLLSIGLGYYVIHFLNFTLVNKKK